MRRTAMLAAASLLAVPSAAGAFPSGVAAGDVTEDSALLWARAPRAGVVRLIVIDADARVPTGRFRTLRVAAGRTVKIRIRGLAAAHDHIFRFIQGSSVSPEGRFRTAPRLSSTRTVKFVVAGGAVGDARPRLQNGHLPGVDFRIDLGATGAATLAGERRRAGATAPLRAAAGTYYLWNGDGAGSGRDAFLRNTPAALGDHGLFRRFRWGRTVDLLLLDARSFRSDSARPACPNGLDVDPAPTLPDLIRGTSGIPALLQPLAAGCRETIDRSDRVLLGTAQYDALLEALRSSPTGFHVIVSPVPLSQLYVDPYDRAEGFGNERRRLVDALRDPAGGIRNVVLIAGAAGGTMVGDLRLQTLEAGGVVGTGITEIATGAGPAGLIASRPDAAAWRALLTTQPPTGVGLRCASLGSTAYMRVTVDATALTVSLRDARRRLIIDDATGQPCPAVVVPYVAG